MPNEKLLAFLDKEMGVKNIRFPLTKTSTPAENAAAKTLADEVAAAFAKEYS